ncbi:RWP-RK domain-containing protein, putative [Phytophthora infestans T30-4]|uniref:RWP-RK domain-containing protein, putative n=1 Tax=Phytophthora infestans (strain T30-4) TaxID=403677 RepID=D0N5K9_PHYIT|nr:RWP-RK domain-containing protein, putative [Phytophthora infestans T30-4]EEY70350.1 RWP-RK domain-containing protein, putative [Phytophthora infestans T30-4]|eukprot:XP_002998004.1 RWP-RK domain-containing protein, putative [Phytophthora infestans T30-4]
MLQPHFERPLQQAADSFGVCTTLLKKICRRNGISNWPYRKICGLRKSIASMAKQVNYFDGEQRRAYADQLEKLEHELQAYLRTGNEPTEEFLRMLRASTSTQQQNQSEAHAAEISHEDDEKEAQAVPSWTARPRPSFPTIATHHRALPSIASILQHQSYSSPSRAASTQNPNTVQQYEVDQQQQWQYFPPTNGNAV